MTYDPLKHHRRSIRLKGYDYSQPGLYFITICTQNRACLFGKIENGEMILNDAGNRVEKWYYELENKYPDKRCHKMVVMPNHFHCIIENISTNATMMGVPKTTNVGVPKIITVLIIKNTRPPSAMQWIGLKQ
jgi:REP element-mobilizing transposase RayT